MYSKQITVLFLVCVFFIFSCGKNETPGVKHDEKEKVENGKVSEKSLTDNFQVDYNLVGTVTGTMNIMRSGNKLKQVINSETMGMKNQNTIFIINGAVYTITEIGGKKFATKSSLADFNKQKETGETIVDFNEFEKFLDSKKITGKENIIGYDCDVYDLGNNISLAVYNKRYILKIKSAQFLATATKLELHPSFAASEFDIPANVDFGNSNPKEFNKKNLDSIVNKIAK